LEADLLDTEEAMAPALPFPPSGFSFTWPAPLGTPATLVRLLWVAAMKPRPWASVDRGLA